MAADWSKALFVVGTTSSAFLSYVPPKPTNPTNEETNKRNTGSLASLSLLTVPTMLQSTHLSIPAIQTQWARLTALSVRVAPPLALLSASSFFLNAYATYSEAAPRRLRGFVAAGCCVLGILPFTRVVLGHMGEGGIVNARNENELRRLLERWAKYNLVRAGLVAVGSLLAFDASFGKGIFG